MRYIVMFSGGVTSWLAARRLADSGIPVESMLLLFADTKQEDEDTYRFLHEAAADIGARLEIVADGRDVWQAFHDARFLGNTRVDVCSRMLKREPIAKWLKANASPEKDVLVYGMTWDEAHRIETVSERWKPWRTLFPLNEAPFLSKNQVLAAAKLRGLRPPRLYEMGFPHGNCGGACVKAGQSQWARLLDIMPERYAYHEGKEQEFRQFIEKDVSILRDSTGGTIKPLTLQSMRERIEDGKQPGLFDWGGCGCFAGDGV